RRLWHLDSERNAISLLEFPLISWQEGISTELVTRLRFNPGSYCVFIATQQ
ncbi:hypothetical protein L9F63_015069, partial [Diploptera punctata]